MARWRLALAAALLLSAPAWANSAAISVSGPRTPGGLLTVLTPATVRTLSVDGVTIAPAAPGRFLVGVPRDAGPTLTLRPEGGATGTEYVVAITPRSFRIQKLPALGETDSPTEEWLARRKREQALLHAARLRVVEGSSESKGWMQAFVRPASGRITGVYGSQRYYGGLARNPHWGLDIAAPSGTPVSAPADGVVRLADGPFLLEGNIVLLDHGGGLITSYLHLSRIDVKAGDVVRQGQLLGAIGTTGRSTGPHLHWGLALLHRAPSGYHETRLDPALLAP